MSNPSEELVEKVARAFCALAGRLPPEKWVWQSFTDEARAILSIARPAIIEEALARLSEVEKALEPFAEAADRLGLASEIVAHVERDIAMEAVYGHRWHIQPNDLRRARAALHPKGQ